MRAVNLLTPELRSAQKGSGAPKPSAMETSGGLGAFALLGALALCVAAVAGYVLAATSIKERKATLAAVSTKNDETVKRAAELKPYADFETLANDRASTVQALASARFDWEQSLRDLSRALPGDVYLSSLKGDVGGASARRRLGHPRARSPRRPSSSPAAPRSQPAVATLMSRLRNVQGVTRVSLSKSEKADARRRPPAQTSARAARARPPSFELVVFFEKATVGAALADATKDAPARHRDAAATPPPRPARPPRPRHPPQPRKARPREPQKLDPAHRGGAHRRGGRLLDARPRAQARGGGRSSDTQISAKQAALAHGRGRPGHLRAGPRRLPRPTTRRSRGSARPSRPTTTCARSWSRSTRPPTAARSTSARSASAAPAVRLRPARRHAGRGQPRPRSRRPGQLDRRHAPASRRCPSPSSSRAASSTSGLLQAPRPLRQGQEPGPRRDGPPAAAQQHLAGAGRAEGLPAHQRRGERELLPAAARPGPARRQRPPTARPPPAEPPRRRPSPSTAPATTTTAPVSGATR